MAHRLPRRPSATSMKLHGSLQKSGSSVSAERLIDSIATIVSPDVV
jgi:hypothetical protein